MNYKPSSTTPPQKAGSHDRLAAALRENLARRKAQTRARKSQAEAPCPPGHRSEPSEKES